MTRWPAIKWRTLACVGIAGAAHASETKTFAYDALGRLSGSAASGGPSSGTQTGSCYDRAGNRLRYDVVTGAPSACPTPAPTPTPVP